MFLTADYSVEPPVIGWKGYDPKRSEWAMAESGNKGRYFLKNLHPDVERVWLAIGEPSSPREVIVLDPESTFELRAATLTAERLDTFFFDDDE